MLPDPQGILSSSPSSSDVEAANQEVPGSIPGHETWNHDSPPELRALISRYACENGVAAAIRFFFMKQECSFYASTL